MFATAPTYAALPPWFRARAALGLGIPLTSLGLLALAFGMQHAATFVLPLILYYGIVPLLDLLQGRDRRNLAPELAEELEGHRYYRRLLFYASGLYGCTVILTLLCLRLMLETVAWGWVAVFALGMALFNGSLILVAHELGHGHRPHDRRLARILLALIGYGHFTLEHNMGHHMKVGTAADPASARYGEGFYAFAVRELSGVLRNAISLETRRGKGRFWRRSNPLLRSWGLTLALSAPFILLFGWAFMPVLVLHHLE